MCLSLVIEILCKRHTNNLSREVSLISFEPERNYSVSGLLNNILELGTAAAALVKSDNVALLNTVRGDIYTLAVYSEMSVSNELSCFSSCKSKAHSVNNIVKTGLEDSDKVITGLALHLGSNLKIVVERLLKNAVDELEPKRAKRMLITKK